MFSFSRGSWINGTPRDSTFGSKHCFEVTMNFVQKFLALSVHQNKNVSHIWWSIYVHKIAYIYAYDDTKDVITLCAHIQGLKSRVLGMIMRVSHWL